MHRQYNEDLFESTKMTFGEHLEELRRSLIKAVAALVIGFLIGLLFARDLVEYVQVPLKVGLEGFYTALAEKEQRNLLMQAGVPEEELDEAARLFAEQRLITQERFVDRNVLRRLLAEDEDAPGEDDESAVPPSTPDQNNRRMDLVKLPIYHHVEDDPRVRVIGLRLEEPFVVYIKAALVLGAIVSSPLVFYFIWQFVAAGLYPHERKYVQIFLPFSVALFLAGAGMAFFVVFRFVIAFLLAFYGWMGLDPDLRIGDWLTFVLILPLGFGISFQLPLVMLFLERIGVFSISTYLSSWRIAVLIIAFLSMILTPSDPYTMMFMGGPLVLLYFLGVALCWLMPRHTTPFGEAIE